MSYPKYVVGNGSRAVFKMFNPNLGVALTYGCEMLKGTVITSENGTTEVPTKMFKQYDDPNYTEEAVSDAFNKGLDLVA
jgi:hypothetical protein